MHLVCSLCLIANDLHLHGGGILLWNSGTRLPDYTVS